MRPVGVRMAGILADRLGLSRYLAGEIQLLDCADNEPSPVRCSATTSYAAPQDRPADLRHVARRAVRAWLTARSQAG
jgi:NADPH-dependent 2,4-dienoyl-CoA reductase/sulfur reductase-like enzyme